MKFLMALIFAGVSSFAGLARASETVEGAKKDYAAAKEEAKVQLDALDKKIAEIQASIAQKSTEAKKKTLEHAENARAKLRAEYDSMKDSSDTKWKSFKKKLGRELDHLNKKAQKVLKD